MNKNTNVVGLIALGAKSNYALLMAENEGLYSLPEASIESLGGNNIVDNLIALVNNLGISIDEKGLAYVVEQNVPDSDEKIITYYFLVTTATKDLPKGYSWVIDANGKIDKSIYPEEFINDIESHLKSGGWMMGNIRVIK